MGDKVSLEVIAPEQVDLRQRSLEVTFETADGPNLLSAGFTAYGIAGRSQATLTWAWDTAGLAPGEHTVAFSILPDELTWTHTVTLLPQQELPALEAGATWAQAETDCCLVYYVTGTEAERDLSQLLVMLDQQAESANQRLQAPVDKAISIVFLPRVLGHGGFAADEIAVSYLDRNYASTNPEIVIHHEIAHILDARLGGELRPSILVEGLAVYLSGGHFKPEPLLPRAAALLPPEPGCASLEQALAETNPSAEVCGLNLYQDLRSLTDRFYFAQHETGYLEAAALIEYMVNTWGWQAYSDFYRDIHPPTEPDGSDQRRDEYQSRALEIALQAHFGLSLAQLEARYVEALRQEQVTAAQAEDVRLTVAYFDTVRRYQRLLDPSAYFLTAWLLDGTQMRERGIVADYLRHPQQPVNIQLENWLVEAFGELEKGNFSLVQARLDAVNALLEPLE